MQRFRGGASLLDLARGPGRLAEAMQIDFKQDGLDLCAAGPLWLAASRRNTSVIGKSVRIGLTRNVDRKLRFYERGNPYVSGPKRLRSESDDRIKAAPIKRKPKRGATAPMHLRWCSVPEWPKSKVTFNSDLRIIEASR